MNRISIRSRTERGLWMHSVRSDTEASSVAQWNQNRRTAKPIPKCCRAANNRHVPARPIEWSGKFENEIPVSTIAPVFCLCLFWGNEWQVVVRFRNASGFLQATPRYHHMIFGTTPRRVWVWNRILAAAQAYPTEAETVYGNCKRAVDVALQSSTGTRWCRAPKRWSGGGGYCRSIPCGRNSPAWL